MGTEETLGICVPITKSTVEQMEDAAKEAAAIGDSVEFRLDFLEDLSLDELLAASQRLVSSVPCPTILTLRPRSEGGQGKLSVAARRQFWSRVNGARYFDLEAEILGDSEWRSRAGLNLERVICSYHDFQGTSKKAAGVLSALYRQHREIGAGCYKYAVAAQSVSSTLRTRELIREVRADGRRVIAISMGAPGMVTRILGLSWGNFLTFGSLDDESATAPGQPTAAALRDLYRVKRLSSSSEVYGIIAKPVSHSLSPVIHNSVFSAAGRDAVYVPFEVDRAPEFLNRCVRPSTREIDWNIRGLSVTLPHKRAAYDQADSSDEWSREARASNTLLLAGGRIEAFNTDVSALLQLLPRSGPGLTSAGVLGSGGAARAALVALKELGYSVTVYSRNPEKHRAAIESSGAHRLSLRAWQERQRASCDVLVNATPVGMESMPGVLAVPDAVISRAKLVVDMVYRPRHTALLTQASRLGVPTLDGLRILVAQAIEQQRIWTGCEPDPHELLTVAERALAEAA